MTIGDRLALALASWLDGQISADVLNRIEDATITEFNQRVIVETSSCEEMAPHLRHIFRAGGRIFVRQSADADTAESDFRALCQSVRQLTRDGELVESSLMAQDSELKVFPRSFHLGGQEETSGERGFQAIYTWRAVACDKPN